jgi:small-conductance mechanosensitive channel
MRWPWLWVWAWLLVPVLLPALASAQDAVATVRVDGQAVFQIGPDSADTPARARADRIEARLEGLLRNDKALGPAAAREVDGNWSVVVSGVPVVALSARDAEDNLTSQQALAALWAESVQRTLDRAELRRRGWGGRFGAETRASIESAFGRLAESAIQRVPRVIAAVLVLLVFWVLAWGVRALLHLLFKRTVEDLTVESLVKQLTYYGILTVGFVVAIDALGFNPTTVAGALGLTGLVLGFALKDILSNFVCGLLLLAMRPFQIGDQIVIGNLEGSVEKIELRATRLRAYDGRVLLVPNAEVFTSRIVNNTADPVRRGSVDLHVGYDTDLRLAVDTAHRATVAADGVLALPPPMVRVDALGPDDITLEVTFWSDSRRADYKNTAAAVRTSILAAFLEAKVGLPNPDLRLVAPAGAEQWTSLLRPWQPKR